MSNLAEIESAVTALPASEQKVLLNWLQSIVGTVAPGASKTEEGRDAWLRRMETRRLRGATGKSGTPVQQMMNDLRGA
jgi:hypothetical protein